MSVLISCISPLIEYERSHLAIILSVLQCPLYSFCRRSGERMMFAQSLLCHPGKVKSCSGRGRNRLRGAQVTKHCHSQAMSTESISNVFLLQLKPVLWRCYCLIIKAGGFEERLWCDHNKYSLPETQLCQFPDTGEKCFKVTFLPI